MQANAGRDAPFSLHLLAPSLASIVCCTDADLDVAVCATLRDAVCVLDADVHALLIHATSRLGRFALCVHDARCPVSPIETFARFSAQRSRHVGTTCTTAARPSLHLLIGGSRPQRLH